MRTFPYYILVIFLSCFLNSCVDNIDFNQADNFEITPVVAASLVRADITQNDLVVGGSEVGSITQTSRFTVLDSDAVRDHLERIVLRFEAINQFNRNLRIDFVFLDDNDVITHGPIRLDVNANNRNFSQEEEIMVANNSTFTNSRKVQVILTLLPSSDGSMIDINVPTSFTFKSAGTFHFRVN